MPASPDPPACQQWSHYSTSPRIGHIEIGLLQCSTGRLTTGTDYDHTTSVSTICCGMPGLQVMSKGACHSMSSSTALAACPLPHPVQTVLHYAFSFQRKLPVIFIRHRSDSECQQAAWCGVFGYNRHWPTTCYHHFAQSSARVPFITLVRLHGTDCLKTFAQNLTSPTFENFSKLTILILCLTFNNYFTNVLVMHPWPSSFPVMGALEMLWLWLYYDYRRAELMWKCNVLIRMPSTLPSTYINVEVKYTQPEGHSLEHTRRIQSRLLVSSPGHQCPLATTSGKP